MTSRFAPLGGSPSRGIPQPPYSPSKEISFPSPISESSLSSTLSEDSRLGSYSPPRIEPRVSPRSTLDRATDRSLNRRPTSPSSLSPTRVIEPISEPRVSPRGTLNRLNQFRGSSPPRSLSPQRRQPLTGGELSIIVHKAQQKGKFYHLRDERYIPLSDEYWRTEPDLVFLYGFNLAGTARELEMVLDIMGYNLRQIADIMNSYDIRLSNFETTRNDLYQELMASTDESNMLQDNQFTIQVVHRNLSDHDIKKFLKIILKNLLGFEKFALMNIHDDLFLIFFETVDNAQTASDFLKANNTGFGLELRLEPY